MRRRDFVERLPVLASGLVLGASTASLAACAGARYLVPSERGGSLVISGSDLDAEGRAFVQSPGMARPVFVHRSASGELVAVLASCTHQGCQPEPVGERLVCPCHGSEFSFDGAVLQGPAQRPLTRYPVSVEDGDVVIRLSGGAP